MCRLGKTPVLVPRAPEVSLRLQLQWLGTSLETLAAT